jgi:hypothetical protein
MDTSRREIPRSSLGITIIGQGVMVRENSCHDGLSRKAGQDSVTVHRMRNPRAPRRHFFDK